MAVHQPLVENFFENLWPEASSSSSNERESFVSIVQVKTCLKEWRAYKNHGSNAEFSKTFGGIRDATRAK